MPDEMKALEERLSELERKVGALHSALICVIAHFENRPDNAARELNRGFPLKPRDPRERIL